MARFAADKIEELKARADIVEVIGAQVRLRKAGRNFVGLCPFHNEKTPSFSVNRERGFFHCFGCGAGGTVFDFVMRTEGASFPEALRSLARRYGVELPAEEHSGPHAGEREAMLRANQVASEFFGHVLWNTGDGAAAREYLTARGISLDAARTFMLGYSPARPASLAKALAKRGLLEAGAAIGLVRMQSGEAQDAFRARVMFPIRDAVGRVIAFGGRVMDTRLPKYINSPESPIYSKSRNLYGIHEARPAITSGDRAILVEGYFDVIAAWQGGFKEVVASLGTSLTVEQLRLVSRYTRNVMACFDGDDAGRKASMRALEVFLQAGLLGRAIFVPPGFDPDTLIRERGAPAFAALIESAELLIDYFLRAQAVAGRASVGERARAAERVVEILRMVNNPYEFDLLARKAAPMLGVGEEVLRAQTRGRGRVHVSPASAKTAIAARPPRRDAGEESEIGLLALALLHPALRGEIFGLQPFGLFRDAELAAVVREVCESQESLDFLHSLVSERLSQEQMDRLSEVLVPKNSDDAKAQEPAYEFNNVDFRRVDEEHFQGRAKRGLAFEDELERERGIVRNYYRALMRYGDEVDVLRRAAAAAGSDDAAAAEKSQQVIALRRANRQR